MIKIKDIFSLIFSIIGIILILFLTYYSSKWLTTKTNLALKSKYMNIVDKIMLGQNKFLAIAEINNEYYLLSITEKHINILEKLEDFHPVLEDNSENSLDFSKILSRFTKNK